MSSVAGLVTPIAARIADAGKSISGQMLPIDNDSFKAS